MSELTTKTVAEEAPKPTLADANEEVRTLLAAKRLMDEWGLFEINRAVVIAHDRVRGARRRQGYDPAQD